MFCINTWAQNIKISIKAGKLLGTCLTAGLTGNNHYENCSLLFNVDDFDGAAVKDLSLPFPLPTNTI